MTETADKIPQTPPENQNTTKKEIFNVRGSGSSKQPPEQTIEQTAEQPAEKTPEPAPDEQHQKQTPKQNPETPAEPSSETPLSEIPDVTFIYRPIEELPPEIRPSDISTPPASISFWGEKGANRLITRYLPLSHCRSYPICKSFELRVMRSKFTPAEKPGELDVEDGPVYEFLYDGRLICVITVKSTPLFQINDAFVLYVCKKEVAALTGIPYENLAKSTAEEIPPWEREEPVRTITPDMSPESIEKVHHTLNETGYAERFAAECRGWLIYDTPGKTWYAWNESHWEPANERLGKAKRFVADSLYFELSCWKKAVENEMNFARVTANEQRQKELKGLISAFESHAHSIHQKQGLEAMEKIANTYMLCADLNKVGTHSILTFQNGGVDCVTGQYLSLQDLARHKEKYPLHYVDRKYDPNLVPEHFEQHLHDIFLDNTSEDLTDTERESRAQELKSYFKRLLGYALTPGNARNLFVFLWGTGANGKSTTIDALRAAIPSEIAEVSSKELLATQEEKPTSGLYAGLLRRIMYFAEISDSKNARGPKISRESIKILSGEKKITARALYKNSSERQNLCLPVAATNELPSFDKEPDKALMRRIVTIPFMHEFSGTSKRLDMGDILEKEGDAVFSMMINELLAYLKAEKKNPGSGLPELPLFCRKMQGELLSGPSYNAFVQDTFEPPAENEKNKVFFEDIKFKYLSWCIVRGIPVDTKLKTKPEINNEPKDRDSMTELTKGEANRLGRAMDTNGYKSGTSSGRKYYWCRFKHE